MPPKIVNDVEWNEMKRQRSQQLAEASRAAHKANMVGVKQPEPVDEKLASYGFNVNNMRLHEEVTKDKIDLAAAQKFLQSRGYKVETQDDAANFVKNMSSVDRVSFIADLAEFVAATPVKVSKTPKPPATAPAWKPKA